MEMTERMRQAVRKTAGHLSRPEAPGLTGERRDQLLRLYKARFAVFALMYFCRSHYYSLFFFFTMTIMKISEFSGPRRSFCYP